MASPQLSNRSASSLFSEEKNQYVLNDAISALQGPVANPMTQRIESTELGGYGGGEYVKRRRTGEVLAAVAALVAGGGLSPHVAETFPLDRAAEAMLAVESGGVRGKCVIEIR